MKFSAIRIKANTLRSMMLAGHSVYSDHYKRIIALTDEELVNEHENVAAELREGGRTVAQNNKESDLQRLYDSAVRAVGLVTNIA